MVHLNATINDPHCMANLQNQKDIRRKVNKHRYVVAIILAALIFGAGHLPAVMAITTLTPLVIARTIVLNAAGGIIFGWLYWKKGLESVMVSHFSAGIVLHVILPLIAVI